MLNHGTQNEDCSKCDGTGFICLCCKEALDGCECGEDQEPCFCDCRRKSDDTDELRAILGEALNK